MYNYKNVDSGSIEYVRIVETSELQDGERLFVEVDNSPIVIFLIAGEIFAIGDICSHDDGPLGDGELEEAEIICPRHGARFDIRNGKTLSLPAIVDIPAFPTRIVDEYIEVGFPKEE